MTDAAVEPGRERGGFAALVAAGILLSRLAALVRMKVFAHYFGTSPAAGAFTAALRIPNLLQNLFGEGVLSASFIPVYSRLLAAGEVEMAGRVAGAFAALLALTMSVLVAIGVAITPWLIDLIAAGFQGELRDLTVTLVRILFPATGLLVMSAWCLGILNSHRRFFLSYVAPVIWNAAMVATMVFFGLRYAQFPLAIALAWGTVAGSFLQFAIQLPAVFRYGGPFSFRLATHLEPVRLIVRNTGPVFLGRGAVQISAYIDLWIASLLGAAAVAAIGFAQQLYLLPVSLFGMSIAAAELPQMSGLVGSQSEVAIALRARLERALRQVNFFVIPSAAALILIGDSLVAALYQGGEFGGGDTRYVWYILIGSTIGLLAATQARSFNSAFYALHDTRTPLKFALVRIAFTGVVGYLFAFPLRPAVVWLLADLLRLPLAGIPQPSLMLGAVGLTISTGIAAWLEFLLLRGAMARRIGAVRLSAVSRSKMWAAAIAAGILARIASKWIVPAALSISPFLPHIVGGAVVAGVFGVLYFALGMVMKVPEARATIARIVPRMR